jgi:hypothetical protein
MSEPCRWLHEKICNVRLFRYPLEMGELPENAIYFFYEEGEKWGHGSDMQRIVRIGTHKDGNFKTRISEHFLLNESKMDFDLYRPSPKDRSIFRKNLGRVLLNQENDDYLSVWNIDFTLKKNREQHGHLRNIAKEKQLELEITRVLRENFAFRFIMIDDEFERMGTQGLESSLIGTVARCENCRASATWLGNRSPIAKIRSSGLWQIQHLNADRISAQDMEVLLHAISITKEWIEKGADLRR